MRHPVILTGIDSDTRKIYISRFLETVETTNTTGRGIYIIAIKIMHRKLIDFHLESTSHTRHSQDSIVSPISSSHTG